MAKVNTRWTPRLQRAQSSNVGIRLNRKISGTCVLEGFVLGVGRKWLLMADVHCSRIDGYVAVRIRDIARIQPLQDNAFYRKVAEATGTWPPAAPETLMDLDTTRRLIETAHVHGTIVTLYSERTDPDEMSFGVPMAWSDRSVSLQEVTPHAMWDGTLSEFRFENVTRVEFSSTYERDLLLIAGAPPRQRSTG